MRRRPLGLAITTAALVLLCASTASAAIYWNSRGTPSASNGTIGRAAIDGSSPNAAFIQNASYGGVASNGTHVFWGNQDSMGRATAAGTDVNQTFAPAGQACGVISVAANATEAFFLASCASPSVRKIMRVPAGGGTPQPLVASGPSVAACGIAIDSTYLYWSDFNTIGRVPLAGGTVEPAWLTLSPGSQRQLCGLAVDSQYIYFGLSDTHNTGPTAIGRVGADGSAPNYAFIPNTSFFGGSSNPVGLAVDSTYVYWGNQSTTFNQGSVGRALKNGLAANNAFIAGINFPLGVAVDFAAGGADDDGDGVPDATDNCPALANTDQANADGDGSGNLCDEDDDNDSVLDGADNCPTAANQDQGNSDGDGQGDACDLDDDGDGVPDGADNCPALANSDQRDDDLDGLGRACDPSDVGTAPPPMRIGGASTSNSSFAPGSASTPLRGRAAAKRGTVFSFRLDNAGTVRIAIQRAAPGRRSGGRCRKPSRRLRGNRACTRWVTQHTLVRTAEVGVSRVPYSGRVRGRALRPGRHRAVFRATAPGFTSSKPNIVGFRVIAG